MKKQFLLLIMFALIRFSSSACNASFTHTYACAGDTVFFYALDQFAVYTWDFGDTASGVANVSHDTDSYHIYMNPGTYYVTLFVNIGAEWDYRTQIIQIGTDCFNASFSSECAGNNTISFTNESTGDYSQSYWYFGDPASGPNDSSNAQNPTHTFSSPGSYLVTIITTDGAHSDTTTQTVNADSTCFFAVFYNTLGGDCYMDTTVITVGYTGQPTSFQWNFGDTASGPANTSTDSIGRHYFSAPGIYLLTLVISNGIQTDTFYNVQYIIDCSVWPGNINMDGEVNMEDLLALGIYYGDTGAVRSSATNSWTSQPCSSWNSSGFNLMYLQDIVDKKNADCNGDGIVNTNDLSVINQNYGLQLPNYYQNDLIQMMPVNTNDPYLVVSTPTNWTGSANVSLLIGLSSLGTVQNIYGIAARIYYNSSAIVPGSVSVDFNNGWLGTPGVDLIGLSKDFYANGYIDFGIVRTDKLTRSANGTIGHLNFTLNGFSGMMNFSFDPVVRLITNGFSGNQEIFLPVWPWNSQMYVAPVALNEIENNNLIIFPNPVNDYLTVNTKDNSEIKSIEITDLTGRIIVVNNIERNSASATINCNGIASGVYLVTVYCSSGRSISKIRIE